MNRMKKISTLLGMPWGSAQRKLYRLILIELLKRLNENICFRCSKPIKIVNGTEGISVDHIENWESEGSARKFWDINNVRYSHLKCNLRAATDSRRKIGPEGTAWCSQHQTFHPIKYFGKDRRRWNGIRAVCQESRKIK